MGAVNLLQSQPAALQAVFQLSQPLYIQANLKTCKIHRLRSQKKGIKLYLVPQRLAGPIIGIAYSSYNRSLSLQLDQIDQIQSVFLLLIATLAILHSLLLNTAIVSILSFLFCRLTVYINYSPQMYPTFNHQLYTTRQSQITIYSSNKARLPLQNVPFTLFFDQCGRKPLILIISCLVS